MANPARLSRLTGDRGGIFWEGEGCCRRPPKYDGVDKPITRDLLIFRRYPTINGREKGESDTSRDDQFNVSIKQILGEGGTVRDFVTFALELRTRYFQ